MKLGPVPCHDCGTQLIWKDGSWTAHECRPVKCMTAEEWHDWDEMNRVLSDKAPSPCWDCNETFATIMRGIHRCNGTPGVPIGRVIRPANDPVVEARRARWREANRRRLAKKRAAA